MLIQWGTGQTTGSGSTPGPATISFPIGYIDKDSYFVYLTSTSDFVPCVNEAYKAYNSMSVEQAVYSIGYAAEKFYWLTRGY